MFLINIQAACMQDVPIKRPNRERSEESRTKLMNAARRLFVEKGYAETGTPEIVASAQLTRGALYHHFADKRALFRAVVEREAAIVAEEIDRRTAASPSAYAALIDGGRAFMEVMADGGR